MAATSSPSIYWRGFRGGWSPIHDRLAMQKVVGSSPIIRFFKRSFGALTSCLLPA